MKTLIARERIGPPGDVARSRSGDFDHLHFHWVYARHLMAETNELARDGWRAYFDELSRSLTTTQATVEIDGPDLGAQVQSEGLLLSGISYDDRDDVLVVGLSPGGPAESLEHFVSSPQRITVESSGGSLPSAIEVEDGEGQRTLVRLKAAGAIG
jgi:hypothetical protein